MSWLVWLQAFIVNWIRFDASCTAVYFNGIAGIMAYQKSGLHIVASDLLDNLPEALKKFDQIENN